MRRSVMTKKVHINFLLFKLSALGKNSWQGFNFLMFWYVFMKLYKFTYPDETVSYEQVGSV